MINTKLSIAAMPVSRGPVLKLPPMQSHADMGRLPRWVDRGLIWEGEYPGSRSIFLLMEYLSPFSHVTFRRGNSVVFKVDQLTLSRKFQFFFKFVIVTPGIFVFHSLAWCHLFGFYPLSVWALPFHFASPLMSSGPIEIQKCIVLHLGLILFSSTQQTSWNRVS